MYSGYWYGFIGYTITVFQLNFSIDLFQRIAEKWEPKGNWVEYQYSPHAGLDWTVPGLVVKWCCWARSGEYEHEVLGQLQIGKSCVRVLTGIFELDNWVLNKKVFGKGRGETGAGEDNPIQYEIVCYIMSFY